MQQEKKKMQDIEFPFPFGPPNGRNTKKEDATKISLLVLNLQWNKIDRRGIPDIKMFLSMCFKTFFIGRGG